VAWAPVVLDSGGFGADLSASSKPLADLYEAMLADREVLMSFVTVVSYNWCEDDNTKTGNIGDERQTRRLSDLSLRLSKLGRLAGGQLSAKKRYGFRGATEPRPKTVGLTQQVRRYGVENRVCCK
jgi:hypothetical protein